MDNQKALNDLAANLSNCNTAQAIEGAVAQHIRQYAACERQVKIYPNGLVKVEIQDKNYAVVGEYTRPAKGIWIDQPDDAGYMVNEHAYIQAIADFAASLEEAGEVRDIGSDVFGEDTRTVVERREAVARQLRRLAQMAGKLADKIECAVSR